MVARRFDVYSERDLLRNPIRAKAVIVVFRSAKETDCGVTLPHVEARSHHPFCSRSEQRLCEMLTVDGSIQDPLIAHAGDADACVDVVEPAAWIVAAEADAAED